MISDKELSTRNSDKELSARNKEHRKSSAALKEFHKRSYRYSNQETDKVIQDRSGVYYYINEKGAWLRIGLVEASVKPFVKAYQQQRSYARDRLRLLRKANPKKRAFKTLREAKLEARENRQAERASARDLHYKRPKL
jgi:erythromycin esterase-like protein